MAVFLLFLLGLSVPPVQASSISNATDRAVAAANASAVSAQRAAIARDLGLNALRNAMAVSNLEQERLLLALKAGESAGVRAAEEAWEKAVSDIDDALDTTQKIIKYADRSVSSHTSALDEAMRASKALKAGEAESAAKKAEQLAATAEKSTKTAESLAEMLKKKWLIPSPVTVAPSTAAPQPSATDTPIDNRR
jgi:hypothetical protein